MILNDDQITQLCQDSDAPMISPFRPYQVRETDKHAPAISSGLSSFGYDITLSSEGIKAFWNVGELIDPKAFKDDMLVNIKAHIDKRDTFYILPPNAYALGVTNESFNLPVDVIAICYCKSTYARCGLIVNTTPLEPAWRGRLVLEFRNATALPLKVYANEGIAQVVFFRGNKPRTTYADRSGKYQDQKGIVTARI